MKSLYFRLKRWYRTCRSYCTDRHYRLLVRSGLFDRRYYLANDPGIDPRYIDPLIHYLETGWREGRKPNILFDSNYYRELNPQCGQGDPLLHYIEHGWRAGADPTPLFFTAWYARQYPESTRRNRTPLQHYLHYGWQKGYLPNPYTDFSSYLEAHPELRAARINPLGHYIDHGFQDKSGPLPFFDPAFYLEDNPAAGGLAMSPLAHYLQYGVREGRAPNRFFDAAYYLAQHAEAGPSQLTAFLHFCTVGQKQGNRPNPLFDPAYYERTYPECRTTYANALLHYQEEGIDRGYYPCAEVAQLAVKPVISIITPVYNTDEALLRRCINSVLFQAYPHWQLCLADDGSDRPHVRQVLEGFASRDSRIKLKFLEHNQGIASASNEAAALADGEYLAFLDHDDELTREALYEVVLAISDKNADLLYTDEDLVNLESRFLDSFYKPDFNPELLLTHNYITHLLVTRRDLFATSGGFSSEYEGAQDYDLVLKLTEQAKNIVHIPKPLYHWRASATSTSVNHSQKVYADASGKRALEAALDRRGISARVEAGQWRYYYRVRRAVPERSSLSLIVPFAGREEAAEDWYSRMTDTLPEDIDIHCLVQGEKDSFVDHLRQNGHRLHFHCQSVVVPPATLYNRVAQQCESTYLLFVAADFEPEDSEWLAPLLEMAQERAAGAVTGHLERGGEDLPTVGDTLSWRGFRHFFLEASRDLNNIYCEQNLWGIPIDLCLVGKDIFWQVGGFDAERFPWVFFDLDISLKLHEAGYANAYTPCCRGRLVRPPGQVDCNGSPEQELSTFRQKWRSLLSKGDPYYNPGKICAAKNISPDQWLAWYTGERQ